MRARPASQRGIAVITAMLVVTVGTILAVNMMWESSLEQRRTASALGADQGLMYVLGAEAWAADILRQDLVDSDKSDDLGELWASELPPLPVDGGVIVGRLEDLQGRFNLNNLVDGEGKEDPVATRQFERLLATLKLDPMLAARVVDWLDVDAETTFPGGAEDEVYASKDVPYRTPNTLITTPSELLAIDGFDRDSFAVLEPYVTALPNGTKINVNTASDVVLASLSDNIDLGTAQGLVEQRGKGPFTDISATFSGLLEPEMLERIDGVSDHFLLRATVTLDTSTLTLYSVLQRDASGITRPIFRSFGVL